MSDSMSFSTDIEGSPESIRIAADWIQTMLAALDDASSDLRAADNTGYTAWVGETASAYRSAAEPLFSIVDTLSTLGHNAKDAFRTYATEIERARGRMRKILDQAASEGLECTDNTVRRPIALPPEAVKGDYQSHLRDVSAKVEAYEDYENEAREVYSSLESFYAEQIHPLGRSASEIEIEDALTNILQKNVPEGAVKVTAALADSWADALAARAKENTDRALEAIEKSPLRTTGLYPRVARTYASRAESAALGSSNLHKAGTILKKGGGILGCVVTATEFADTSSVSRTAAGVVGGFVGEKIGSGLATGAVKRTAFGVIGGVASALGFEALYETTTTREFRRMVDGGLEDGLDSVTDALKKAKRTLFPKDIE